MSNDIPQKQLAARHTTKLIPTAHVDVRLFSRDIFIHKQIHLETGPLKVFKELTLLEPFEIVQV